MGKPTVHFVDNKTIIALKKLLLFHKTVTLETPFRTQRPVLSFQRFLCFTFV